MKKIKMLMIMLMLTIALPSVNNYANAQDSSEVVVAVDDQAAQPTVDTVATPAEIISAGLTYVETVPPKGSEPGVWVKWIYGLVGVLVSGAVWLITYIKGKKKKTGS